MSKEIFSDQCVRQCSVQNNSVVIVTAVSVGGGVTFFFLCFQNRGWFIITVN